MAHATSILVALMVATLISNAVGQDYHNMLEHFDDFNPIRLNRPDSNKFSICLAWRVGVEANNFRNWKTVFSPCVNNIKNYMLNGQYEVEVGLSVVTPKRYVKENKANSDKDVFIFDLGGTLLSDLPYYSRNDVNFGEYPYNRESFHEWISEGKMPRIRPVQSLYNMTLAAGYKIVIISGTPEKYREARIANLEKVGYTNWSLLILRKEEERGIPAVTYKSSKRTELVNQGYRIVGNIGDQWSDLLGPNPAEQNAKVPNPMYYVA